MKDLERNYKRETGCSAKRTVWIADDFDRTFPEEFYTEDFVRYLKDKFYELEKQLQHENTGKEA